jgi:hypothetical protein
VIRARLAPSTRDPQVGETRWLSVRAHTCFYKDEELVA